MFGLSKIGMIAALIALAAVGGWGTYQYVKVQQAEKAAIALKAERDAAGVARDKAIEVSKANEATIEQEGEENQETKDDPGPNDADNAQVQTKIQKEETLPPIDLGKPAPELDPVVVTAAATVFKQQAQLPMEDGFGDIE